MAIKKVRIKNGTPIDVNDARINGIDSTPTLNSTNVVMSGGVKSALDGITDKIPAQASSTNQLADKAFVNSSIETATAEFKGTFNSLAELEQVTADNNDYGFVISTDASGNTVYNRYKYNGTEWLFEYSLNNSSFTAAQWAAIQSGITSALVTKLNGIADGAEVNVQSDWNAESGDAFIKNKPQNLVQDADYVHTDNNYTTTEKNKLSGIESGAQKNAAGTVVDANYVHTDNNYTDAEKTKLSGISSGAEVNVLNGVKVNGVEQTATEKKVDISVPTSLSQLSDDASHRVVSDSEKSAWGGKYNKPSTGIPASDLAADVQESLGKADTALQAESDPTVPAWAKAASKPSYSYSEISDKPTLGTAAAKDVPSSGDASATQVVMGNDSRLSDSRPASDVSDWAKAGTKPTYTKGEVGLGNVTNDAQVKRTEMGAASGVATLGSDGKVPASQLPSYVDDVLEYANRQAFPETGESGKIYVALDTNKTFRWSGSAYVEISPSIVIGTTTGTAYDGGSGQALADKLSGIENGAQVNVLDGVKVNGVAQTITDKKVDISVPTALSQLSADATHRVVTDSEKTAWNGKYTKPSGGIPASDLASGVIPDVSQFVNGNGVKNIISLTKAEYDALANKDSETIYVVETQVLLSAGTIVYYDGSQLKFSSTEAWASSLGTPVAVVVVPNTHTPDGTVRCMAVKGVNADGSQTTSTVGMAWGPDATDTGLPNLNNVPYYNNTVGGTISSGEHAYLSSNNNNGNFVGPTDCLDSNLKYAIISGRFIPNPYLPDGSPNPDFRNTSIVTNNACADFNGASNTSVLVGLGTAYSAANACHLYSAEGISAGNWYLPALGELVYIMPRFNEIQNALNGVGGVQLTDSIYYSSSEFGSNSVRLMDAATGFATHSRGKSGFYIVRCFCALPAPAPGISLYKGSVLINKDYEDEINALAEVADWAEGLPWNEDAEWLDGGETPVQSDWNETNTESLAYIKNKPAPYSLPVADSRMLGGVKVGGGLIITRDGVLSVDSTHVGPLMVALGLSPSQHTAIIIDNTTKPQLLEALQNGRQVVGFTTSRTYGVSNTYLCRLCESGDTNGIAAVFFGVNNTGTMDYYYIDNLNS